MKVVTGELAAAWLGIVFKIKKKLYQLFFFLSIKAFFEEKKIHCAAIDARWMDGIQILKE